MIVVPLLQPAAYLDRYSEPDKIAHGLTSADSWPAPFWTVDVAFATMLLLLGVVEEGLGALFFGLRGGPERLRAEFGIPDGWEAIGAVALGWPADDPGPIGSAAPGAQTGRRGGAPGRVVIGGGPGCGLPAGGHQPRQHLADGAPQRRHRPMPSNGVGSALSTITSAPARRARGTRPAAG